MYQITIAITTLLWPATKARKRKGGGERHRFRDIETNT